MTEFLDSRVDRLDAYLDEHDLEAVWFARPNSFAWLTGGDNVVDAAGDVGVAAAGYDGDLHLVTDNIEAPRLVDEEVPDEFAVETVQWYESSLAEAVANTSSTPAAADFDVPGFEAVDASSLRQPLTDNDVAVYRELGRDAADAVESVARELEPGDTEHEVAAALRVALSARDINAPVVLVGGEERAQQYRHYTPQVAELGGYALLSVTAERNGLCASLTRTVAFDPPEWLEERHEAATTVDVSALAATREVARQGGAAGDVFSAVQDAYDAVGFDGEWEHHHQGGAAGYAGREWIATPTSDDPVYAPMAYAWNPTVQGAKSEDTVLVTDDGFEILTSTGDWETQTVESVDGDVALDRHAILRLD
ncbi:Xaa-Pro aminopeptidase [Halogranum amylolyticum]|uniref:Xaa-Pro aminopeptidase n=1 Tax=Halogranum amylolyticum TaxID=660520 RepID=A0A1H8RKX7_9EURY|nr:M24 family metallopeptidase [Halogranum amylolyticum]SEO66623.1 Xaa-Pro aminopeptidase [Halogranum amylolyticum]